MTTFGITHIYHYNTEYQVVLLRKEQKQPLKVFCKRRCSEKLCKFLRKTPALESLFNNAADLWVSTFLRKRLQHRWFPVKLAKFNLTTPILKNICERLLLKTSTLQKKLSMSFTFLFTITFQVLKFLLSFCAVIVNSC